MKNNKKIIKILIQIYLLCPTILNHASKRRPQAQSLLNVQQKNNAGICKNSALENKKNSCTHPKKNSKNKP